MKKFLLIVPAAMVLLMIVPEQSYGIPAFARKYRTSCQTCHNGFPKLTAFGDAFRRNGYQFPGGTDPEFIKEEPVSLGSEGNKKAFPDAVWPGTLPGSSPLSLFLNGEVAYNPNNGPRFTFDGLGNSIEAVAGGTLGEDLSFWGQAALNSDGSVELNRIFLVWSNLVGDNLAFNSRIGVFEPGLFSFSTHRAWMEGYWLTTRPFSDDMAWSIEETQKGIEVNGILQGRFGYSAGIVEGFGGLHSDKDFYGHVTYKFGGLPLDGVTEGGPPINNAQPYIDNSLTLGAFAYHGNASLGPDDASQGDGFTLGGGDVNAYIDRLNLFGGIGIRHDEQPFYGTPGQSANTTVCFAELDVVAYPWLLPGVRFESWVSHAQDPLSPDLVSYTDNQIVPGIVALIRPNVKATLQTTIEKFDSRGDTKFDFGQVILGLAVGI
jgi:hypothetical protein